MPNARQQKLPKALIRRTLESARREIEQIERKFHRTIRAVQDGGFSTGRRSTKAATARTRSATGRSMGRPAPVQTAVTNVLKKRRAGLTLDRLQAALSEIRREVAPECDVLDAPQGSGHVREERQGTRQISLAGLSRAIQDQRGAKRPLFCDQCHLSIHVRSLQSVAVALSRGRV